MNSSARRTYLTLSAPPRRPATEMEDKMQGSRGPLGRQRRRKITWVAASLHRQLIRAGLQPSSATLTMAVHPEGGLSLHVLTRLPDAVPPWLTLPTGIDRADLAWLMRPDDEVKDELSRQLRHRGWVCDWH
jgi:hypothetical protein